MSIQSIPYDLINLIIQKLLPKDFLQFTSTCKLINKFNNNISWKHFFDFQYEDSMYYELVNPINYKESFKKCSKMSKILTPENCGVILIREFPDIYLNSFLDIPFGWTCIVYKLLENIREKNLSIEIDYIKSKFCAIRIHHTYKFGSDISKLIDEENNKVNDKAEKTCEKCGKIGFPIRYSDGWKYILCDSHKRKKFSRIK